MDENMQLKPMPQNYKKSFEWILHAYEDGGVSLANGFQKDVIQNAIGASKTRKFKEWKCYISLKNTSKGKFLIIEDFGTYGLTGKNRSFDEINQIVNSQQNLPPEERLSRFTSLFNSGGNQTGGGLYGVGKVIYAVSSDSYTYYFDSLRDDHLYVANVNRCGQEYPLAFENNKAAEFIKENTGLDRKTTVGTRIIIESPKKEIVDAIESGEINSYIQESWWLIIQRLKGEAGIYVNGNRVEFPKEVKHASHIFELENPELSPVGQGQYKVKHFGLYTYDRGTPKWSGIAYYRKGMRVGNIDINDVPKKLDGKYWGYIEVDEPWEAELAEIEDTIHFGVSQGKKRTNTYQYLKRYCNNKFQECLLKWGYIKDRESQDKKLKDELNKVAEEVQGIFDKLGMESLGKGPKRPDFDVRWQDISYPEKGKLTVTTGDQIGFSARVKSSYAARKTFEYRINVEDPLTGKVVSVFDKGIIDVDGKSFEKKHFSIQINTSTSLKGQENRIILEVRVKNNGRWKRKELPYFYDCDQPDNSRESVKLDFHSCVFPQENSRRVDFGQAIKDISYRIENNRNQTLMYRLNISIHNASDPSLSKIKDIASYSGELLPFETCVTDPISEIVFDRETYEQFLSSGVLEIRARLIANGDDNQYEKGDKITFDNHKIFLNIDEKNGLQNSFDVKSSDSPDSFKRSWYTIDSGRTIVVNVGHAAYLALSDYPEIQHEYLREQMMKQFVMLYLAEGRFDMFNVDGKDFTKLEPQEAAEQVLGKIEYIYSQSLR